jgi:hypothetical protein
VDGEDDGVSEGEGEGGKGHVVGGGQTHALELGETTRTTEPVEAVADAVALEEGEVVEDGVAVGVADDDADGVDVAEPEEVGVAVDCDE